LFLKQLRKQDPKEDFETGPIFSWLAGNEAFITGGMCSTETPGT
jgi:hypothetical protein